MIMKINKCMDHGLTKMYLGCLDSRCTNQLQCWICHYQQKVHADQLVGQVLVMNRLQDKQIFTQIVNQTIQQSQNHQQFKPNIKQKLIEAIKIKKQNLRMMSKALLTISEQSISEWVDLMVYEMYRHQYVDINQVRNTVFNQIKIQNDYEDRVKQMKDKINGLNADNKDLEGRIKRMQEQMDDQLKSKKNRIQELNADNKDLQGNIRRLQQEINDQLQEKQNNATKLAEQQKSFQQNFKQKQNELDDIITQLDVIRENKQKKNEKSQMNEQYIDIMVENMCKIKENNKKSNTKQVEEKKKKQVSKSNLHYLERQRMKDDNDEQFEYCLLSDSAINLVEEDFADDLVQIQQDLLTDKVFKLLEAFFIVIGESSMITDDQSVFWERCKQYFQKNRFEMSQILMDLRKKSRPEVEVKIRLEKLVDENPFIIIAQTYDDIDALCGVLAFVLQDLFSFYGILDQDKLSQAGLCGRISVYNKQKYEYYKKKEKEINGSI